VSDQPKSLSEVRFATILAYSTLKNPESETSRQSKNVRDAFKWCWRSHLERFGERTLEAMQSVGELSDFLGKDTTLVPVPRSAPRKGNDSHWPGLRVARELEARGLCREVSILLERTQRIRKSAYLSSAGDRPSPEEHIETMAVDRSLASLSTTHVTLVDDIVTRGSQLIGAASLIVAAFPNVEVRVLAALMARSGEEVANIYDPVCGTIANGGNNNVRRVP
jgi:hypothetical protein